MSRAQAPIVVASDLAAMGYFAKQRSSRKTAYWASTIFGTLTRAREARGADSRSRFHFLVLAARPSRRRRGWRRLAEPTVPPALPRRPSYAVTAAGRRDLRAAVGAPRQPLLATTRVREARGADSRSRFHFLVLAARPSRRRRGWRRLAEPTVPPALPRRPSYAVTAAGRRGLRAAVGGLRRVLALDFQAGFPAGAVVLLIHWRWQPTGAGDLFFMDRRWPSDAEAAAGRPRPRAAILGHAAVRAQELLRVNHYWQLHACARREVPIPDRGFIFWF